MTAELKINLLAPADDELLRAEGKVVKPGKRLVVVTSEINAQRWSNKVNHNHSGNYASCSSEALKCETLYL